MPPLSQWAHLSWQVGTVDHMVHSCFKIPDDFSSLEAYIARSSTGKAGQQGEALSSVQHGFSMFCNQGVWSYLVLEGNQEQLTVAYIVWGSFGTSITLKVVSHT